MAFFANLNKKTSILKYLEIDKGIKANINLKTEDKIPGKITYLKPTIINKNYRKVHD